VLFDRLSAGRLLTIPVTGRSKIYFRHLSCYSAAFALISDVALAVYGGSLKRREIVSGRLTDALSWLYLASTTLKKFHDDGQQPRDEAVMRWATEHAMVKIYMALHGVLDNLPNHFLSVTLGWIVFGFAGRARA